MNRDHPDIFRPHREPVDLLRLRRVSALERSLFDIASEWPADRGVFVETLHRVADSIDKAGPDPRDAADELTQEVFPFVDEGEDPEPTFGELLERTRELRALGLSWSEAWQTIREPFKRITSALTTDERSRAFERLLAAHASDTDAPVEPPGRYCNVPRGG